MIRIHLIVVALFFQVTAFAQSFDHSHKDFTDVLNSHVVVYDHDLKSAVNYKTLAQQPDELVDYLSSLSQVTQTQYGTWTEDQQLAFLINAYNGFTLQLIVNNYDQFESGDADSIRDLGGLFSSPWELYRSCSVVRRPTSDVRRLTFDVRLPTPDFRRRTFKQIVASSWNFDDFQTNRCV